MAIGITAAQAPSKHYEEAFLPVYTAAYKVAGVLTYRTGLWESATAPIENMPRHVNYLAVFLGDLGAPRMEIAKEIRFVVPNVSC
ncbi:hypothetical protein Cob_v006085 [Colletotrichum orbiculare MAFF 240422]|uniref:Uncharacterized protein n=1 Tax=Colletotrichum orbiculare (strain 104-T / ATCC 96160 / CBS 514.97 / LARS 414 / MAFF 240422) TaxID=1213857 RepID=A0A484FT80_COLOR|nr:hypothetical protein Cob_v006085 [Colletotrichum orbiculare MAFF 240422]